MIRKGRTVGRKRNGKGNIDAAIIERTDYKLTGPDNIRP
jgi:hypothetical protein